MRLRSSLCGRRLRRISRRMAYACALAPFLLSGCGGTGINFIDNFQRVVVEPIGRSFSTLDDRVRFTVPSGAFENAVTFIVGQATGLPQLPLLLLASAVEMRIEGGTPQKPFRVRVAYDPTSIPEGYAASALRLFRVGVAGATLVESSHHVSDGNAIEAEVSDEQATYVVGVTPE